MHGKRGLNPVGLEECSGDVVGEVAEDEGQAARRSGNYEEVEK